MRRLAVLVLVGLLAVACSGDDGDEAADSGEAADVTTTAPSSTVTTTTEVPCDTPDVDERTTGQVTVAGEERTYLVDVPESYDGGSPTPLIVNIHGSGSNAEEQAVYSNFPAVSDAIVALPQGTGDPQGFSLIPGPANPDVQFVRQIVEAVSDDFCVDPARVYATGISNGSALSAELACAAPDLFAAIAMVAATVGPLGCDPSTQMPVLAFHGTADRIVPYDGGGVRSGGGAADGVQIAGAEEQIARWADQDGCDPEPTEEPVADDVVHWTYTGCDAEVEFYRVESAGHVWPGAFTNTALEQVLGPNTSTVNATEVIAAWFQDHARD